MDEICQALALITSITVSCNFYAKICYNQNHIIRNIAPIHNKNKLMINDHFRGNNSTQ